MSPRRSRIEKYRQVSRLFGLNSANDALGSPHSRCSKVAMFRWIYMPKRRSRNRCCASSIDNSEAVSTIAPAEVVLNEALNAAAAKPPVNSLLFIPLASLQIRLPSAMPAISTLPTMTGSAVLSEDIAVRTFSCRVAENCGCGSDSERKRDDHNYGEARGFA